MPSLTLGIVPFFILLRFSKNEKFLLLPNNISSELNNFDNKITDNITNAKLDINTKAIKLKLKLLESTLFISKDIFTTGITDVLLFKVKFCIMEA